MLRESGLSDVYLWLFARSGSRAGASNLSGSEPKASESHRSDISPSSVSLPPFFLPLNIAKKVSLQAVDCCQDESGSSGAEHPDVEGQEAHQEPRRR